MRVACFPRLRERRELLGVAGVLRRRLQRGPARVVERAQHAGDVAQRRMLRAPLRERPRRLAFEVDDDEVVARDQHLAEVIVAVVARLRRRLAPRPRSRRCAHTTRRAAASSALAHRARAGGAASAAMLRSSRSSVSAASARTRSLPRLHVFPGDRLRFECRIARGQRERAMQLARCAARAYASSATYAPCASAGGARRLRVRWPRGSARDSRSCNPSRRPGSERSAWSSASVIGGSVRRDVLDGTRDRHAVRESRDARSGTGRSPSSGFTPGARRR